METVNLNQLTAGKGGIYLLAERPFSGFAIETFLDGRLATQMSLMRGLQDGVTRRWHSNGQVESEKSFRNGAEHGRHQEWHANGILKAQFTWNAGDLVQGRQFDEEGRILQEFQSHPAASA
jgi:antitoxin component YwqK of YwqJK toxin-antitoxin module